MHRRTILAGAIMATLALPSTALADGAVRVLHASPDAPAVDVYVNGAKTVSALGRGAITPYLSLPAGCYRYAIRPAGAAATSKPVLKGAFRVHDGKAETLAARGFVRHLKVQVLRDTARAGFGVAKIRVVHLSPDAPKVDVYVKGGGKVVSRLGYRRQSGYLKVPAGSYTFLVRPAGHRKPTVIRLHATLQAGKVYTAWALGSLKARHGALPLTGVATEDALPASFARTQVRVLHASPDAPGVNVWVNGAKAISSLAFGHAVPADGSYLRLPSGPTQLQVRTADDATIVQTVNVTLPPQATLTVAARGTLGTGDSRPFELGVYADDVTPTAPGKARVKVVHLSPDAPAVAVFAGATAVIPSLAYPDQSAALDVRRGRYTFDVKVAPAGATVGTLHARLRSGTSTAVYAIGLAGGSPALSFKALQAPLGS
jgi:hypothetical protein